MTTDEQIHSQWVIAQWLEAEVRKADAKAPKRPNHPSLYELGYKARQTALESIQERVKEHPAMVEHCKAWMAAHPGQKWVPKVWLERRRENT